MEIVELLVKLLKPLLQVLGSLRTSEVKKREFGLQLLQIRRSLLGLADNGYKLVKFLEDSYPWELEDEFRIQRAQIRNILGAMKRIGGQAYLADYIELHGVDLRILESMCNDKSARILRLQTLRQGEENAQGIWDLRRSQWLAEASDTLQQLDSVAKSLESFMMENFELKEIV